MDPLAQPAAGGIGTIVRGTSTDPARQRDIPDRSGFNIPEGMQPRPQSADPEEARRALFRAETLKVAQLIAVLSAVSRVVPGVPGKIVAVALAGVEKDPGTGRVRPASGIITNLAPVPIGYIDPKAYGVKRNYYLPAGASGVIPRVFDRVGLGIPEQRREDEENARVSIARHFSQQSTLQLQQFLTESTNEARSQRISARVASHISEEETLGLARAELLKRNAFFTPPDPELSRSVGAVVLSTALLRNENLELLESTREDIARLDAEEARIRADLAAAGIVLAAGNGPLATPPLPGSKHTTDIEPVTGRALANQEAARGIRRELVSERADP